MLNKRELKKIKKELPKGAADEIKSRLSDEEGIELSVDYIRKVLNGDRHNQDVIEMAISVRDNYLAEIEALKEKI